MMLAVKPVAERLRISASLVYSWCEDHLLPHYRMGGEGKRGKILIEQAAADGKLGPSEWYILAKAPEVVLNEVPENTRRSVPSAAAGNHHFPAKEFGHVRVFVETVAHRHQPGNRWVAAHEILTVRGESGAPSPAFSSLCVAAGEWS
jgi:hypothetical protein